MTASWQDPYYRPPEARRFGVHPYDIRRVLAGQRADVELALCLLVRVAERCGPMGERSRDRTLYHAVLKDLALQLIEIAWSEDRWTAMAASDAICEIRLALRERFPAAEEDGGMGE